MSPDEHARGRSDPPGYPDEGLDLFGVRREPRQYPPSQPEYPPSQGQYPPSQDPYSGQDRYERYEPDDYGQYPDQPRGRGRLIGIFAGLGIVGLVIGVIAAKLMGAGGGNEALVTPLPSATAAQTPAAAATDDAQNAGDDATPTPSATKAPNYRSIPEDATTEKGLDFGFLTKISQKDGVVSVRFDRAYFYTGAEATKRNKGVPPDDDYLIENSNPDLRTFQIDPEASIIATNRIANKTDGVGPHALTLNEFVTNTQTALSDGSKLPIWVRHTNGLAGPITALAEQYLP
jgi:hypothetical protein